MWENVEVRRYSEPASMNIRVDCVEDTKPLLEDASSVRDEAKPIHPNQEVVLDEVGEGELLESKLVLPDDMVNYLNQVKTF